MSASIRMFSLLVGLGVVLAFNLSTQAQTILWVDDNADKDPGPGNPDISDPDEDGSAEHPFDAIQEAVNVWTAGAEIVLKDGDYTGTGNKQVNPGGRAATIRSELGPENCTIDCQGSGRAFLCNNLEGPTTVIEGIKIVNGNVNGDGGAIKCDDASPTIRRCVFEHCDALWNGGAISCAGDSAGSNPLIEGCTISYCTAGYYGGAIDCYINSSPTIHECNISWNSALEWYGGGIFCWGSHAHISKCNLKENWAEDAGGGIACGNDARPTIETCDFSGNQTNEWGTGGALYSHASSPHISACSFSTNIARLGGALFAIDGYVPLTGCYFNSNIALEDGGALYGDWANVDSILCTFEANIAMLSGGAAWFISAAPRFEDCSIIGNIAHVEGGGVAALFVEGSRFLLRSIVTANRVTSSSGTVRGGGIYAHRCNVNVINSLIVGNLADGGDGTAFGGGISVDPNICGDCDVFIVNSTIGNNRALGASKSGGGAYVSPGTGATAANSVFWDNEGPSSPYDQIGWTGSQPGIIYSDVQGGWPGTGNINADPAFCAPGHWDNGLWVPGDSYRLRCLSPCLDAGADDQVPFGYWYQFDLDNNERFVDLLGTEPPDAGIIDMGPYERQGTCIWDLDSNCVVNPVDYGIVQAHFGCDVGTGDPDCDACDLDGDGDVDPIDGGLVLQNMGPCPCQQ